MLTFSSCFYRNCKRLALQIPKTGFFVTGLKSNTGHRVKRRMRLFSNKQTDRDVGNMCIFESTAVFAVQTCKV